MLDFSKAIKFVIDNADAFREIFDDSKDLYRKLMSLYLQWNEPVTMGAYPMLASQVQLLEKMGVDCVEVDDRATMQSVSVLEVIRFLVVYGPLIKQILEELRKK